LQCADRVAGRTQVSGNWLIDKALHAVAVLQELWHRACELKRMDKKKRWLYTAVTAALLLSTVLAEVATGRVSGALVCLGKSPIAGLVAASNALALVP